MCLLAAWVRVTADPLSQSPIPMSVLLNIVISDEADSIVSKIDCLTDMK